LHHDREHILAPDQATIKERQTWRHQHDQAGAQQHEGCVADIERNDGWSHGGGVNRLGLEYLSQRTAASFRHA